MGNIQHEASEANEWWLFVTGLRTLPIWERLAVALYLIMAVIIVLLEIFSNVQGAAYYMRQYDASPMVLLLAGLGILLVVAMVAGLAKRDSHTRMKVAAASILLFLLQILLIRSALFQTGWDVADVTSAAYLLSEDSYTPESFTTDYFNLYPNNRMILILVTEIVRMVQWLGGESRATQYEVVVLLDTVLYDVTGVLLFDLIRRLSNSLRTAWFGWGCYVLLVGLSPWILIAYTDSMGVIFPVLLLWLDVVLRERRYTVRWGIIGLVGAIAYRMKAPCAVVLIAIVIVETLRRFHLQRVHVRHAVIALLIMGICVGGVGMVNDLLYERVTGVEIDGDRNIGMLHYFKMGLNADSVGTFNYDDVDYSMWARTTQERNRENLEESVRRLEELGPIGVAKLYLRKDRTVYNDGSFGFALEGAEFIEKDYATVPVAEGGIADGRLERVKVFIRDVWRPDGRYFHYWVDYVQAIWLALLFLAVPGAWLAVRERQYLTLLMSLIGAWMFMTLFEAQQRYIFVFVPVYIALVAGVLQAVNQAVMVRIRKWVCRGSA